MDALPQHIIDRLLILNPELGAVDAHTAIQRLYDRKDEGGWRVVCYQFNVPQIEAKKWRDAALMGVNVPRLIARWLDMIGVTEGVLEQARISARE
jgi:hypothetical protein